MKQRVSCPLAGFTDCWIESVDCVTLEMYNEWFANTSNFELTCQQMLEIIGAWNFTGRRGEPIPQPTPDADIALFNKFDIAVRTWLVRGVSQLLTERVTLPFQNASTLPPSPTDSTNNVIQT